MPTPIQIGSRLHKLRGKRTQAEVAYKLDVSQNAVNQWEKGKRVPTDENKVKLSKLYNVSVNEIFFE